MIRRAALVCVLVLVATSIAVAPPVAASPSAAFGGELGGQLFATGGAVEVQVLPAAAGFTSELWLFEPVEHRRFIATNRQVGTVVQLGTLPAGVELVFGIFVRNTGITFRMGPASRNPDNLAHAKVNFLGPGLAQVGFEDLFGGGDRDYDDNVFEFRGGVAPEPLRPPVPNAGPDQSVPEGSLVRLDATASSDPDGDPLTYAWSLASVLGPPVTLSSATSATPTFQALDDATYRFAVAVSDGEFTRSDEVEIRVTNLAPAISAQGDPAFERGVALVTATFTDAGAIDTHTGRVDWGDGSPAEDVTVSADGSGWGSLFASHVYARAGTYDVEVTAIDDDRGEASASTQIAVSHAVALWANSRDASSVMEATSGTITVEGLAHTNGSLRISGGEKRFSGPTEYVADLVVSVNGATFDPAPVRVAARDFPIRYDIADYRPGARVAIDAGAFYHDRSADCVDGVWSVGGQTLASGVYYVDCATHLSGAPFRGTITLAAEGDIQVSGTDVLFDPFVDGLLFLSGSASDKAVKLDTSKSTFFGYTFTERGRIVVSGSGNRVYCGLLGDRVDIAARDLLVRGSGCSRPARTVAPPVLVPSLDLTLAASADETLPGADLAHTATITNAGATLLAPGVVALENLGDASVTVTAAGLALEYRSVLDGGWHALPGTSTLTTRANAASGVAYPASGIAGTTIAPRALASWGYSFLVSLTPEEVLLLLDPARVAAIRVVADFTTDPAGVPVRRLFRFGDDFSAALRAQGGVLAAASVTVIGSNGTPRTFDAATTPALISLAPGASVDVSVSSAVEAPAARGTSETDAAYVARLLTYDGTRLVGSAYARANAGVGDVLGLQQLAFTTRRLPVLSLAKSGPADVERGDLADYTLALANAGSAEARAVALADAIAGVGALSVTGAPAMLAGGASAEAHATYGVPAGAGPAPLVDTATVTWSDAAGGTYGPVRSTLTTRVLTPRTLVATKGAELLTDADGSRHIRYGVSVTNLGDVAVTRVALADTPDVYTPLAAGSVTTSQGTVTAGNAPGDTSVAVDIGTVAGRTTVTVLFTVDVAQPFPDGVAAVVNQATVTSAELAPVLSDDPLQPGAVDPTRTPIAGGPGGGGGGGGGGGLPQPIIETPSLADGTVVYERATIATAITPPEDQTIVSWRITARRVGTAGETLLASGTGAAPPALAAALASATATTTAEATIDATRLPNGVYVITITAQASGGGTQSAMTSVIVEGALKLGRYTTSYLDLDVGVGGLPLQVIRTYDSFDKSVGDFGVGWDVAIASFRVATSRPLGYQGWIQETTGCGLIFCQTTYRTTTPHYVSVVWPDGHQELFDLTPLRGSTFFRPLTAAAFTARPGSTSTLEVEGDNGLMYTGDGNLYGGAFGSGGVFDPPRFRLTTREGTSYVIDRALGLISARDRSGNTLTVDAAGVRSSLGPSITFTRDALGRITQLTGPASETRRYAYSAAGDLASYTDGASRTYTYSYDARHNLLADADPAGRPFQTLEYDDEGRLVAIVDAAGNRTAVELDVAARREVVTDPTGRLNTTYTFDALGDVVRVDESFEGRTLTHTFTYDALGRPLTQTDPHGGTTRLTWDDAGNLTSATDAAGRAVRYAPGPFGQLASVTDPSGVVALRLSYDDAGNLVRQQRADGSAHRYEYDARGLLTRSFDPADHETRYTHGTDGRLASVVDPLGRTQSYTYDASGRLLTIADALGTTRFTYDGNGALTRATGPTSRAMSYTYDALGNVLTVTDPAGRVTAYDYDAAGRRTRRTDRAGAVTTYTYDAAGRLTGETQPGGRTATFRFDPLGRLSEATNPDARLTFAYDDVGDLVSETSSVAGRASVALAFAYDAAGALLSAAGPDGTLRYAYDAAGRLATLTDVDGSTFRFAYDALDRLARLERPNGVTDHLAYDAAGGLESRAAELAGASVARQDYARDAAGQLTGLVDGDGTHSFAHDAGGRLTAETHPAASGIPNGSYAYDAAGDRTAWTGSPASAVRYDAAGRLLSDGAFDYGYDLEGRLVRKVERATGRATTYAWSANAELLSVTYHDGTRSLYRYDALGRRVEVDDRGAVTGYTYDGENVRLEHDASGGVVASYTTAPGAGGALAMRRSGAASYHLPDALGSTVALTDAAGAVTARTRYDAYGRAFGASGPANAYTYTGQQRDAASGLSYYRARYYDPAVGRFISEDPLGVPNLYAYAGDDPVDFVDPSGMQAVSERAILSAQQRAALQAAKELSKEFCGEIVGAALGIGPNLMGSLAEDYVSQNYLDGLAKNTTLFDPDGARRVPDFVRPGGSLVEVKNTRYLAYTQQLRDLVRLTPQGGTLTIFVRRGTQLSGPLLRALTDNPFIKVLGCLPG